MCHTVWSLTSGRGLKALIVKLMEARIWCLVAASLLFSISPFVGLARAAEELVDVPGGRAWISADQKLRIELLGDAKSGYDVSFETREAADWVPSAAFPQGQVWAVRNVWNGPITKWYSGGQAFKVSQIHKPEGGVLECQGSGAVDGQPWEFLDRYSFEYGAIKVVRRWHHASPQAQSPISLVTVVRVPVGDDPRTMLPGIIYNGNVGTYPTSPVPRLLYVANAKGVFEEHRFPVPFVNLESTVAKRRLYTSLLTIPSKVPNGHLGDDQWWSLGLEWRWDGTVDLLSVSGAVATNGMNSTVYGNLNGFVPYEDAYIDVKGETTFEKTFYIDCGIAPRVGYAFRESVQKALRILKPVDTTHLLMQEAMDLKLRHASDIYHEEPDGTAGFPFWPLYLGWNPQPFMYGWVGGELGVAYGLLAAAERTGNQNYRRMAVNTIQFFVDHVRRDTPGLLFGDYYYLEKRWEPGQFGNVVWPNSVSARQLGESLEQLADCTLWAKAHHMAEADRWQKLLMEAGDFLVTTQRYKGMFPRSWYPDGRAVGWEEGKNPTAAEITAAGAMLVSPLVKVYQLTGDKRYLETAESVLRGYYDAFGHDLHISYSGATLDAAAEDKEAGWGFLHGALAVYEATKKPEYLEWAHDAADWLLTWYVMYDMQLPPSSPLHGFVNTTGWTAISVQNEELDCWGQYLAPDFYRLGKYLGDQRYQDVGRTLFYAPTQAIARPGAMFGLKMIGMELEHFNHTNCTYIRGGAWRGSFWSAGILWSLTATVYNGPKMAELGALVW
ncbi:MAG: hypothetical protein ABSA41_12055 [Terriglobia bacterium]|jgi:hypothetical protein